MTRAEARSRPLRWVLVVGLVLGVVVMHSLASHHGAADVDHHQAAGSATGHDAEPAAGGEGGGGAPLRAAVSAADSGGVAAAGAEVSSVLHEELSVAPSPAADPDATANCLAVLAGLLLLLVDGTQVGGSTADPVSVGSDHGHARPDPAPPTAVAVRLAWLQILRL